MNGFLEKRQAALSGKSVGPSVSQAQLEAYPNLCMVLQGIPDPNNAAEREVYSLTMFAGEGEIRFALSCKQTSSSFFGRAGTSDDILGSIERALAAGDVEAKREKTKGGKTPF